MKGDEYEFETTASRAEAAGVLTDLADGVLAGSVLLGDGPDALTVEPPAEMDVEVEFEVADDSVSLEVELEWPQSAEGATVAAATEPESDDGTEAPARSESGEDETESGSAAGRGEAGEFPQDESEGSGTDPSVDSTAGTVGLDTPIGATDGSQSLARFELFRDRRDEWRWRLRHRNGNIVATSGEGYTRKHNAQKGLRSVVENAPGAEVTEEQTE